MIAQRYGRGVTFIGADVPQPTKPSSGKLMAVLGVIGIGAVVAAVVHDEHRTARTGRW